MKKLSEVLPSIKPTAELLDKNSDLSNMQVHGSTTEDGKMITQSTTQKQSKSEEVESQRRQQSEECLEQKTPISENPVDKKKLTLLVKSCFEALNTYGGGNDALEASIMLMQMTLSRFDYSTVRKAFEIYLQGSSDMPKPADIVKIIEPPVEPRKWCTVTFLEIKRKKREDVFTSLEEDKYCIDFVDAQVSAPEDNKLLIEGALRQAAIEDKRYWA